MRFHIFYHFCCTNLITKHPCKFLILLKYFVMKRAITAIAGIGAAVPDIIEVAAQCLFHQNVINPSPL